jgi:glucose-6-phosphate isomerase
LVDNNNVLPEIIAVKNQIKQFTNEIVSGNRKGYTGKPFTDVVNIGIGGSDLGQQWLLKLYNSIKII